MIRGVRRDGSRLLADLEPGERSVIRQICSQLIELLEQDVPAETGDPAVDRLIPNAYPDDSEAAAEFRRFTAAGITERRRRGAQVVIEELDEAPHDGPVVIAAESTSAWLRTVTSLRLVLATRLGIDHDGDSGRTDEAAQPMRDVYDWLGWLQESLIVALDG